jgi:large subunit ribosomal protein L3
MNTLIGLKLNMSQIFAEDGTVVPLTYIDVNGVTVIGKRVMEKDGYDAVILGYGQTKSTTKADEGKYKELGYVPRYVVEVKCTDLDQYNIGDKVKPSLFVLNQKVNVTGYTKGKGFQGVIKRWGFAGGPRTHGQSDRERHPGSLGMRTTPGRVFKGKKMGGRMGNIKKTVKGLKIMLIDEEKGLLGVKGAVPGNQGSLVVLKSKLY